MFGQASTSACDLCKASGEPLKNGARTKVLSDAKIKTAEQLVQRRRLEIGEEGLADRCNPSGALGMQRSHFRRQAVGRITINHLAAALEFADCSQRRNDRLSGQVRNNSEPDEETPLVRNKTGCLQLGEKRVPFKIDRCESKLLGDGDTCFFKTTLFPDLGRRMVDLEDGQPVAMRVAIGKRVEPGAKHDQLLNASRFYATSKGGFRKPGARGNEHAHAAACRLSLRLLQDRLAGYPKDGKRERVGEDAALIHNLMRRTIGCGGKGGAAGFLRQHGTPQLPAFLAVPGCSLGAAAGDNNAQ